MFKITWHSSPLQRCHRKNKAFVSGETEDLSIRRSQLHAAGQLQVYRENQIPSDAISLKAHSRWDQSEQDNM